MGSGKGEINAARGRKIIKAITVDIIAPFILKK
jgi:hypothetical protein